MKKGFTLIETIIVIAILGAVLATLATAALSIRLLGSSSKRAEAWSLIEQELSALRSLSFSELTTRTNTRFLGVLHNRGEWLIKTEIGAPSASNVLALNKLPPIYKNFSGLIAVPSLAASNFTLRAMIKLPASSSPNWGTGFLARARDLENHYRVLFKQNSIKVESEHNGTTTELSSNSVITALDTWYKLEVQGSTSTIKVYLNDLLIRELNDQTFEFGQFALFGANDAEPLFDDVTIITNTTTVWGFDNDTLGKTPNGWKAASPYDLKTGTDLLTINDYLDDSSIKHIKAQIDWQENNTTSTVKIETLISQ